MLQIAQMAATFRTLRSETFLEITRKDGVYVLDTRIALCGKQARPFAGQGR